MHNQESHTEPLSIRKRLSLFYLLIFLFICIFPIFVFYANGYRYSPWDEDLGIHLTGGMYIGTQVDKNFIFINNRPTRNSRFFRRATYVQGLNTGIHDVRVYGDGLQTWFKKLPVYPQFVTEFNTFTLPELTQLRPITRYMNEGDSVVLFDGASTTLPFYFASTTRSIISDDYTSSLSYQEDPEYDFLKVLFAHEDDNRVEIRVQKENQPRFRFATTTTHNLKADSSNVSARKVRTGNLFLEQIGDEVYAIYDGPLNRIPYYFCVPEAPMDVIKENYGQHVANTFNLDEETATSTIIKTGSWHTQLCRTQIRIDRMNQTVRHFDFLPNETDFVILHLDDGIYVTEIDDRAWQNHQLLYPDGEVTLLVSGKQIFIRDGEYFAELFTTLQQ